MSAHTDTTTRGIAPDPTNYDFDPYAQRGMADLLARIDNADSIADWSKILFNSSDLDYLAFGNNKIAKSVAIFNLGSATDCPHLGEPECQVDASDCYAHNSEQQYDAPLAYRRRQEVLWNHIDPLTFADAVRHACERKQRDITALRFNQSGDVRTQQEVYKIERIAQALDDYLDVYLYTASSGLDWSVADHVTVNASNDGVLAQDGVRGAFDAVPTAEDIPADGVQCAYDHSDGHHECGDCRLCISDDIDKDVYVTLH